MNMSMFTFCRYQTAKRARHECSKRTNKRAYLNTVPKGDPGKGKRDKKKSADRKEIRRKTQNNTESKIFRNGDLKKSIMPTSLSCDWSSNTSEITAPSRQAKSSGSPYKLRNPRKHRKTKRGHRKIKTTWTWQLQ